MNTEPQQVPKDWVEKWHRYGPIKLSWIAMNSVRPMDLSDEKHWIVK